MLSSFMRKSDPLDMCGKRRPASVENSKATYSIPGKSKSLQRYTINGIQIEFPFKAYPCQISMMEKVHFYLPLHVSVQANCFIME